MKVIEAPNKIILEEGDITCFLAGGITDCPDWQAQVIDRLNDLSGTDHLVILNPRRAEFDVTDPTAAPKQIAWEFDALNHMDIFSMYFCNSSSVQPICFYELGRHLERMQHRFTKDWQDRIIVSVENGYSRTTDVTTQTMLALGSHGEYLQTMADPISHARLIYNAYIDILAYGYEEE